MEIFGTAEFVWSQRPSTYITTKEQKVPEPRMRHTATKIGATMFMFGGATADCDSETAAQGNVFNTLYMYDAAVRTFYLPSVTGEVPSARCWHSACMDEETGDMFVFGGLLGGNEVHRLRTAAEPMEWATLVTHGQRPRERHGHLSCVYKDKLYIIGGRSNQNQADIADMYSLDLTTNFWDTVRPSGEGPVNTSLYSGQLIDNTLYCIGTEYRNDLGNIMYLNLDTCSWMEKKARGHAPAKRWNHATCILPATSDNPNSFDQILMTGGRKLTAETNVIPVMEVHLLTVAKHKFHWEEIVIQGRVPVARYGHTLGMQGSSLFMFGGKLDGKEKTITREMKILVHQKWEKVDCDKTLAPISRTGASVTVMGKKLYLVGGAVNGCGTNDVFIFDPQLNAWQNPAMYGIPPHVLIGHAAVGVGAEIFIFGGGDGVRPMNGLYVIDTVGLKWLKPQQEGMPPAGGVGCSMVVSNLKVIVYGGFGGKAYSNDVAVLDTASMRWTHPLIRGDGEEDRMPEARVGHTAVMLGPMQMFVFGGSCAGKVNRETWCLDLTSYHWFKYENRGDVPYARFAHASANVNYMLYVFGGSIRIQEKTSKRSEMNVDFRSTVGNDLYIMQPNDEERNPMAMWTRPVLTGILPVERYRHVMCHTAGMLYLFSGSHGGSTLWRLDTGHWDPGEVERASAAQAELVKHAQETEDKGKKKSRLALDSDDDSDGGGKTGGVDHNTEVMLDFLQELNLAKYNRVFLKQKMDWKTLLRCNNQDLLDMGVAAIGPRKKILKKLREFILAHAGDDDSTNLGFRPTASKPNLFNKRFEISENTEIGGGTGSSIVVAVDIMSNPPKEVVLKFIRDKDEWSREVKFIRMLQKSCPEKFVVQLIDREKEPNDLVSGASQSEIAPRTIDYVPNENVPLWDRYTEFTVPGFHWIAMEKASMTLREYLRDTRVMYETQRKGLFERIMKILEHLAKRGVVHADVKPENFGFFGDDMQLRILDFGKSSKVGKSIVPVATPAYCSPEMAQAWVKAQRTGKPQKVKASTSMDVWAAGMILFETYLGNPVLGGKEGTFGLLDPTSGSDNWLDDIGWGMVDNEQAVRLLKKQLLVVKAKARSSATIILKSAYLTGGLDSEQWESTFGTLGESCLELNKKLGQAHREAKAMS